ncbi:MAG: hypothetical protein Q8N43_01475 [Candidatus Azambacteria bacterium]|nr:hypothetical protein [Candidatus Azambacteria bacterium]
MEKKALAVLTVLLVLFVFASGCARVRIVNAVTVDQKFSATFGFVQKIETSRESFEDLYLPLNNPQVLEKTDKTKSLELRIWIFNPGETFYELQKAVCKSEPPMACAEEIIYRGQDIQKLFRLEAPLTEPGTTKILRALIRDKNHPFPFLIIGDGIYTIPEKEAIDEKKMTQS